MMKKPIIILFTLLFVVIYLTCQNDVNKTEPPARVNLVPKTLERDTLERGVDAVFNAANPLVNNIVVEWYSNSEKTLAISGIIILSGHLMSWINLGIHLIL